MADSVERVALADVCIRPYQNTDHDAVVDLYLTGMRSYSNEEEDAASKAQWEQVRQDALQGDLADVEGCYIAAGGNFWVATARASNDEEELVAMVALQPSQDGQVGVLRRMSVKAKFRRLGIGRRLVTHLENWARAHGFTRVELTTGTAMALAVGFYRAAGYTLTRTSVFSRKPYHEAAHFAKDLDGADE